MQPWCRSLSNSCDEALQVILALPFPDVNPLQKHHESCIHDMMRDNEVVQTLARWA
jgi:hypothetical protein